MASDVFIMLRSVVVIALLFVSFSSCQKGLYAPEDKVKILDTDNFNSTVFGSQNSWLIEFYSSWCGHCIRFAPTWKQLAKSVKDWKPVITIAAVNCAEEKNLPLCRHYAIEKYPTMKFFPAMSLPSEKGDDYSGKKDVDAIKYFMVSQVERQSASNRPQSWPKLHVLPSMELIWQDVGPKVKKTVIFLEAEDTDIGRELIIELVKFHPTLTIRRMQKNAVAQFGIRSFPSAYLIDKGGTFELVESKKSLRGFTRALRKLIHAKDEEDEGDGLNTEHGDDGEKVMTIPKSVGLHIEDLESALHYSLRQEIAQVKVIEGLKLNALKDYIAVLAKYYPGRESTSVFLQFIEEWLNVKVDKGITGEKWLSNINDLQSDDIYLNSTIKWVRCAGSSPKFRGYPCGLWSLFHTLSVTAALRQEQEPIPEFNSQEVLLAMRGYIEHFFGCRECSENFQKMASKIDEEVGSPGGAVLWLWKAHNSANKRLHGDASEDPHYPKIQYPSAETCDKCYYSIRGNRVFNETAVLKFMKRVYSNIIGKVEKPAVIVATPDVYSKLQRQGQVINNQKPKLGTLEAEGPPVDIDKIQRWKENEKQTRLRIRSATSWGFTSLDMSLCVVFYVVCTMIVCLLYLHLSVHKKKSLFSICRRSSSKLYV